MHICILLKNVLELTAHTMSRNPFCKLVFKCQTKYSELEEILLSKKTPLYLRGVYYRLIFESYFSTNNFNFQKVYKFIEKVINQDLFIVINYCKFVNKFGFNAFYKFFNIPEQKITKDDNEFEKDIFQDQIEPNEQSQLYDGEIYVDEEESGDKADALDFGDSNNSGGLSLKNGDGIPKANSRLNMITGKLSTIWFQDGEMRMFLAEKQNNNKIDGFIPFLADLTTYIISNMKKFLSQINNTNAVMEAFLYKLEAFEKNFPKLKLMFSKGLYEHSKLLLSMTVNHCRKILKITKFPKKMNHMTLSDSDIIYDLASNQRRESENPETIQGYSFIKNLRHRKWNPPRKIEVNAMGLEVIDQVRSSAKLTEDIAFTHTEHTLQNLDKNDQEESMTRQIIKWEQKTEEVMNILRYSLMTKRMLFSDALEDIFDDELVKMEQKLVGSLVRLIEESVETKYNFLVVFEDDPDIKISFQEVKKVVRFIKINNSDEQEGIISHDIEEELNIGLDNYETIRTIILLNDIVYCQNNNTGGIGNANSINKSTSTTQLTLVESFMDLEQINFLDKIKHNMALRSSKIERFISNQSFYMLFLNHAEFNALAIQSLIRKKNDYMDVLNKDLFKMDVKQHKKVFFKRKIENILSSQQSRFLFLNSIKIMIEELYEHKKGLFNTNAIVSKIQKDLSDKFLGLFCLKMFVSPKENDLIRSESLEILYLLLLNGNEEVQRHMFETIVSNYSFLNFIETIEMYLERLDKRIQQKLFEIQNKDKRLEDEDSEYFVLNRMLGLDPYKLLTNIFRFLQVLTENCHKDFQNIMREQIFVEHNSKNNLIKRIIDVIIGLGEFISFTEPNNQPEDPPTAYEHAFPDAKDQQDNENQTRINNQSEREKNSDQLTSKSRAQSRNLTSNNNIFDSVMEAEQLKKNKLIFQSKYCRAEYNNKRGENRKILKGINLLKSISKMENRKLKSVIHFGLIFLNDVIMGPNKKNQKIVLLKSELVDFLASIIAKTSLPTLSRLDNLKSEEFDYYDYLLFSDAANLFLLTTNRGFEQHFYEFIFDKSYLRLMDKKINSIFHKIIIFHKRKLYSGQLSAEMDIPMDSLNKFDVNRSEISRLAQKELDQNTLNNIQQRGEINSQQFGLEIKQFINVVLIKVIQASHKMYIYLKRAHYRDPRPIKLRERPYFRFYEEFYGYVEIKHQEHIYIVEFTRPYKTHFHYDRNKLRNDFRIKPQHQQIVNFIERIEIYNDFLRIRQKNYRFNKGIYFSTKNKYMFEFCHYLILLIINIAFLISAVREKDGDLNVTDLDLRLGIFSFSNKLSGISEPMLVAIGILNIFFAMCIMILNFPEEIPLTKFYWKRVHRDYINQYYSINPKPSKFKSFILKWLIWITNTSKTGIGYWVSFQNIYAMLIFGLCVLALFIPFIYPFLLLDIVQRSKTLGNIIKSVSNNSSSLTQTLFLTLVIMYIYATVSFTYYPDHYQHGPDSDFQNYCYSLATCFFTVINNGLRAGGGLGEAIGQPTIEDSRYILRYIMDLTFMIIILIILLNIVFGIIIDTFGDMRNAKYERDFYLQNICLICNLNKSDIDSYGEGYEKHIKLSHSLDDYVHFMIYIKNKDINKCDGIEQNVKKRSHEGDHSFMPNKDSFYFKKTVPEDE